MAIQPMSFPMLSFAQANPFLTGLSSGAGIANQFITNKTAQAQAAQEALKAQFAPQTMAEQLKQLQYKTEMDKATAQYADPMELAKLQTQQQMPGYYGATTAHLGAETEKLKGLLPSEIAVAKIKEQYPLLGLTGVAQQVGAAQYLDAMKAADALRQSNQGGVAQGNIQSAASPLAQQTIANVLGGQQAQTPSLNLPQTPQQTSALATMFGGGQQQQQPQVPPALQQALGQGQPAPQVASPIQQAFGGGQQQQPTNYGDMIRQSITQKLSSGQARTNYFNKLTQAYDYRLTPPTVKNQMIAQASGMGYDPNEASSLFVQGHTLKDLAAAKGFDQNHPETWPDAIFAQTPADITRSHVRGQAVAELDSINNQITKDIAPYARKFGGYSVKQIADAFSSDPNDHDAIQHLLAANIVMPELAGIRNRGLTGAPMGVEMMQEVIKRSLSDMKVPGITISPADYIGAQNIANDYIRTAVEAAKHAGNMFSQTSDKNTMNVSEENLQHTMQQNKLTRDEAIKRIENKYGKKVMIGSSGNVTQRGSNLQSQLDTMSQQLETLQAQGLGGEDGGES